MRIRPSVRRRVATCLGLAFVAGCVTAPPIQEMSDARQAISAAEEAGADRYAPDQIAEARRFLQAAESEIAAEAYGAARTDALRAQDRAMRALGRSLDAAVAD